ncbi:MAG: cyclic nucleotide-binding domain-containing protein [Deltaproteobacteria bacterium]|nr:cyclic nucleotide-binding domain-containing protein [Deltaproteobacteria bacterium]TLN02984.1 MAG: cyclic nucleotide-binding domain-containing protein [bacterium]
MDLERGFRSFDALRDADLQEVYERNKREALSEHAFHLKLDSCDSLDKLKDFVFGATAGFERWTARELLEISNRFRLFAAPEYEIHLYEESRNAEFRAIPRAREFYLLALNKVGRTSDAIIECRRIIAEGGDNGFLWGILGNSYANRMLCAEKFARVLEAAAGDLPRVVPAAKAEFLRQFPDLNLHEVTLKQVHFFRRLFLDKAVRTYQRGFELSGDIFPGFYWMLRTLDQYVDLLEDQADLQARLHESGDTQLESSLHQVEVQLSTLERYRSSQPLLLRIAMTMGGDREALDFWPHAGELQLAFVQGQSMQEIEPILARSFATIDTEFKMEILFNDVSRIRDQYSRMVDVLLRHAGDTFKLERILATMQEVHAELAAGRDRFMAGGKIRGAALNDYYRELAEAEPAGAEALFLKRTFSFRAMVNNLVPQYVQGGIGRVGARVPDLMINRNVQEDLQAIINEKVLPALSFPERRQPLAVIELIQRLVGAWLALAELQDLQSPAHQNSDSRSDGLILLSGIDPAMRIGSRSTTDLTAALLLGTGDCRETMYLNGALFACYQQMMVFEKLKEALKCLKRGDLDTLRRITSREIPALLRYQLRGGHVAVYVEGLSMRQKYHVERVSEDDPLAVDRHYGLEEFRAGKTLTRYELDNAKLRVRYSDGTIIMLEPRDPVSGYWRPLEHRSVPGGGGAPRIPETSVTGGVITDIQLLNLVEEHTMSFLYDSETGRVELCDGFYNHRLFNSPYQFGSGSIEITDLLEHPGLIRAGTRPVRAVDGTISDRQVFIEFLPHSTTDYTPTLGSGDFPGVFQLMGRLFEGILREERRRLEDGTSAIPAVLEKVQAWQFLQNTAVPQTQPLGQRFARVLIELARDRPELVAMRDVHLNRPLVTQDQESDSVFLILSGQFQAYQDGKPVEQDGLPVTILPGALLGEVSALRGALPTATVAGDGVVLRIGKSEFLRQLDINPDFRESLEELEGMLPDFVQLFRKEETL